MRDRLQCSFQTLAEVFDVDAEKEITRLEKERGTSVDPVKIEEYKNKAKEQLASATGEKPSAGDNKTPGFDNPKPIQIKEQKDTPIKVQSSPEVKMGSNVKRASFFERAKEHGWEPGSD